MKKQLELTIIAAADVSSNTDFNKPIVITGLAKKWSALQKWNIPYFTTHFGNVQTGNIPVVNGACDFNTTTGSRLAYQTLQQALDNISTGNIANGVAVATPADVFPSELKADYPIHEMLKNKHYVRDRIFIGAKDTVTSLHQDLFHNLYTMVKGTKRITLYAPYAPVYPNSRFSKLPNHAQVDPENPDYKHFPNFKHAVPYVIELKAGETLFIPPFWWHHLRNIEESIAVSFWWAQGWTLPLVWLAAQYKKYRGI